MINKVHQGINGLGQRPNYTYIYKPNNTCSMVILEYKIISITYSKVLTNH